MANEKTDIVGVACIAFLSALFGLGLGLGGYVRGCSDELIAVSHGHARYNQQTGKFEWNTPAECGRKEADDEQDR